MLRVLRLFVRSYRTRYLILLPTNTRGSTAVAQKVLSNSRSGKSDLAWPHPLSFTSVRCTHHHLSSPQSFSQLWNPRSTWIACSLYVVTSRSKSTWFKIAQRRHSRETWNFAQNSRSRFLFCEKYYCNHEWIKLNDNYFKYSRASLIQEIKTKSLIVLRNFVSSTRARLDSFENYYKSQRVDIRTLIIQTERYLLAADNFPATFIGFVWVT